MEVAEGADTAMAPEAARTADSSGADEMVAVAADQEVGGVVRRSSLVQRSETLRGRRIRPCSW